MGEAMASENGDTNLADTTKMVDKEVEKREAAAVADDDEAEVFNFEGVKKKKKKKKDVSSKVSPMEEVVDGTGRLFVRGPVYPYEELLHRITTLIDSHNPDLQGTKRYTIKPPQVARVGSKKVAWTNFQEICRIMQRNSDHVLQFVIAELGAEGSIGGDGQLTLKGKFGPKHIESLLRRYISKHLKKLHGFTLTRYVTPTLFLSGLLIQEGNRCTRATVLIFTHQGHHSVLNGLDCFDFSIPAALFLFLFIAEYVTCSMCKSPNTTLKRDSSTRLYNIHCAACGASRSVTTIKSGYHATSRADRRKAKNAA